MKIPFESEGAINFFCFKYSRSCFSKASAPEFPISDLKATMIEPIFFVVFAHGDMHYREGSWRNLQSEPRYTFSRCTVKAINFKGEKCHAAKLSEERRLSDVGGFFGTGVYLFGKTQKKKFYKLTSSRSHPK